jgi:hypothetical protein
MVFNLRIHEINRNVRKLTRTLTLIKKLIYIYMITFYVTLTAKYLCHKTLMQW